jgi:hypothetical protein
MKSKMARPEARRAGGNVAPDDRTAPEAATDKLLSAATKLGWIIVSRRVVAIGPQITESSR